MPFIRSYAKFRQTGLDLNDFCIKDPLTTYFVKLSDLVYPTNSFEEGDVLVVDRNGEVQNGAWAIISKDGQLVLQRLLIRSLRVYILPLNPKLPPIPVDDDVSIWGIVTFIIRKTV